MTENNIGIYRKARRKNRLITVIVVLLAVGLNFLLFKLVSSLGLPLYLDCAGTILASALGGYIPGMLAGILTNIVNCFTDPSSIYYAVLSVLIAAASAFFAQKGWLSVRKPFMLVLYILTLTFIGGGLGTILPWMLDGLYFDSESFGAALVNAGIKDQTLAQLLGNLIMDALDKTVTVIIVLVIKALIPAKIKEMLLFTGWMQRPMSGELADSMKDMKCRSISVRTKIMSVLITALLLLASSATAISFVLFRNAVVAQQEKLVNSTATSAALEVNGDMIDEYLAHSHDVPGYDETEKSLYSLLAGDEDIRYIYVYKITDDGCHVVFDLDTPDLEADKPGAVVELDKAVLPFRGELLAGEEIGTIVSDDSFGKLITAYKPIYSSDGKCVAYAAVDVSMYHVDDLERNFITGMIALYLAFFIVIFTVVLWVIEYHIVKPVNSMSAVANSFAFNNTDEKLNENVDMMRALDIHTGDEIENLYGAVLKTASDSVAQVEDIRRKNETIKKMQDALILVLADIVESRDKNTGDHVRKTAAYSRVIMKEMKKKGYYADELTDSFIENVSSTAPMHDIGKIKVSDVILNKPGRLTDEEFKIMQDHTAYGREIIDEVIELVPESDYLREARDLAYSHHEKWNGSGYPEGRSGEDIPLSARVMAVADVFDALVSKRSYKEPFSFEQARNIIREGAGVHFDPLVADAFLSAEEETMKIAESFGDYSRVYVEDNHVDDSGKLR